MTLCINWLKASAVKQWNLLALISGAITYKGYSEKQVMESHHQTSMLPSPEQCHIVKANYFQGIAEGILPETVPGFVIKQMNKKFRKQL